MKKNVLLFVDLFYCAFFVAAGTILFISYNILCSFSFSYESYFTKQTSFHLSFFNLSLLPYHIESYFIISLSLYIFTNYSDSIPFKSTALHLITATHSLTTFSPSRFWLVVLRQNVSLNWLVLSRLHEIGFIIFYSRHSHIFFSPFVLNKNDQQRTTFVRINLSFNYILFSLSRNLGKYVM